MKTKFYWQQRFPAHRTVVLTHSYRPVTGQFVFTAYDLETHPGDSAFAAKDYCLNDGTLATARAKLAAKKKHPDQAEELTAYLTDYVLKSANNWNGPIGRFHLTLDKVKPDNILSLCWDGNLVHITPTEAETTLRNFAPAQDLHMLVLEDTPKDMTATPSSRRNSFIT